MTDDERKIWLAIRKEAGLKIDPETAEVEWIYALTLDPYGVYPEMPEELQQVGRGTSPVLQEATCGSILAICLRRLAKPYARSASWRFREDLQAFGTGRQSLQARWMDPHPAST